MNMDLLSIPPYWYGGLVMAPMMSHPPASSWLVWWPYLQEASCQSCNSPISDTCTLLFNFQRARALGPVSGTARFNYVVLTISSLASILVLGDLLL
jgi:hypothetical protein